MPEQRYRLARVRTARVHEDDTVQGAVDGRVVGGKVLGREHASVVRGKHVSFLRPRTSKERVGEAQDVC